MKLKIKKYLYFLNDVTSLMLKQDIDKNRENAEKLRLSLIVVSVILIISIILNIYFIFYV